MLFHELNSNVMLFWGTWCKCNAFPRSRLAFFPFAFFFRDTPRDRVRVSNDIMPRASLLANSPGGQSRTRHVTDPSAEDELEKKRDSLLRLDPAAAKKKSQAELDLEREAGVRFDDREVFRREQTDLPSDDGRRSRSKRVGVDGRKPEGEKRTPRGRAIGANNAEWARAHVEPIVEKEAGESDTTRRRSRGAFSHDANNFRSYHFIACVTCVMVQAALLIL